jgi:hypothetical protein
MATPLLAALRSQDEMDSAGATGAQWDGHHRDGRRRVIGRCLSGRSGLGRSSAMAALRVAWLAQADVHFDTSSGQLFVQRRHGIGECVESGGVFRGQGDVQHISLEREERPHLTEFGGMQTDLHAVVAAPPGQRARDGGGQVADVDAPGPSPRIGRLDRRFPWLLRRGPMPRRASFR